MAEFYVNPANGYREEVSAPAAFFGTLFLGPIYLAIARLFGLAVGMFLLCVFLGASGLWPLLPFAWVGFAIFAPAARRKALMRAGFRLEGVVEPMKRPPAAPAAAPVHAVLELSGESFTNDDGTARQTLIAALAEGESVTLVREPQNRYDPDAIRVDSAKGTIGYVAARQADRLAPDLDAGWRVRAQVKTVAGEEGKRGVWIEAVVTPPGAASPERSPGATRSVADGLTGSLGTNERVALGLALLGVLALGGGILAGRGGESVQYVTPSATARPSSTAASERVGLVPVEGPQETAAMQRAIRKAACRGKLETLGISLPSRVYFLRCDGELRVFAEAELG